MLHQDKKRWKQVKHHWFDIIQPIRPHLRWKFFTISCKNITILFSMWQEKMKMFMEWTVFSFIAFLFLILLYMFAIKKLINTLKWLNTEIFKLVLNMSQSYFLCDRKSWKFHGMNCFFLHCHPISYFIIHVCNHIINKHSKKTQS